MAIYHFSVKNVSRADGRSAVAAAAYRSGEKLIDERQGKEQDYTRKTGVEFTKIYAPENTNPELLDRNQLWNTVEKVENRKNSQLAREFEIAFPHELNQEQRQGLLNELCQDIVKRHGVVVDAAIHAPHTESGSDKRNYHAHILLTTRSIDEQGNLGKKTREFNDHGKQQVEHWRERFADLTNSHLARAGHVFVEVDHRSYKAQGLDLEATQHEGSSVTRLRRQGIDTEISLKNDAIKARNAEKLVNEQLIKNLDQEIVFNYETLARLEIERKEAKAKPIEPQQPKVKQGTTTDARNAIASYRTAIEETAHKVFKELQDKQINDAKAWLAKIDEMRANTPMFFGKKDHLAKIEQEVAQYEKMRSNFAKFKETGVTDEHRAAAIALIEKTKPNMVLNAKNAEKFLKNHDLEQAKKKIDPNISMLAEAHKAYTGKILRTDSNGTIQQTQNGLVYHPNLNNKDVQAGKEYTLTYTEKHVKINENIDYSRNKGQSKDQEFRR